MDSGVTTAVISAAVGVGLKWLLDRFRAIRRPQPLSVREYQQLVHRMNKQDEAVAEVMGELGRLRGTLDGLAERVNRWQASHGD